MIQSLYLLPSLSVLYRKNFGHMCFIQLFTQYLLISSLFRSFFSFNSDGVQCCQRPFLCMQPHHQWMDTLVVRCMRAKVEKYGFAKCWCRHFWCRPLCVAQRSSSISLQSITMHREPFHSVQWLPSHAFACLSFYHWIWSERLLVAISMGNPISRAVLMRCHGQFPRRNGLWNRRLSFYLAVYYPLDRYSSKCILYSHHFGHTKFTMSMDLCCSFSPFSSLSPCVSQLFVLISC